MSWAKKDMPSDPMNVTSEQSTTARAAPSWRKTRARSFRLSYRERSYSPARVHCHTDAASSNVEATSRSVIRTSLWHDNRAATNGQAHAVARKGSGAPLDIVFDRHRVPASLVTTGGTAPHRRPGRRGSPGHRRAHRGRRAPGRDSRG